MRLRSFFALGLAAGSIGAGAWLLGRTRPATVAPPPAARSEGIRLFEIVLKHVRENSVDSLSDPELYRLAASGVLGELDDPYATLLSGERGRAGPDADPVPLGLHLDRQDGLIVVVAPVPGSPAAKAGVRSGDRLVAVDSTVLDASELDRAWRMLEDRARGPVTIRVRRTGVRATLPFTLDPGPVPVPPAVTVALLPGGIMRVTVGRFVPGLADSVLGAVQGFRARGGRALVLDLRGVVGGTLADGAALADLFLAPGATLALRRGREAADSERVEDRTPSPFDSLPMAVLVDAGSAGAAEAAAGSLQDNDRAAILGGITFGRGVTQRTFPLGPGTAVRLTTSLWFTPAGRQIQRPPRSADGDSMPRPGVKSRSGRPLQGGGGIVPDRLVAAGDGSADPVLAAAQALLLKARSARAVLAALDQP